MGSFAYKAKDSSGKTVAGTVKAPSHAMATTALQRQRLRVISLKEVSVNADGSAGGGISLFGAMGILIGPMIASLLVVLLKIYPEIILENK